MRRAFLPMLLLAGVVLFTGLGIWQLHRRVWKLDLIHRVETRVHAPAQPLFTALNHPFTPPETPEYLHVTVTGTYNNAAETPVLAVTSHGRGYWILTPLTTANGLKIIINRGFVPTELRDPASRPAGQTSGTVTVTGLLRLSEPYGAFLHTNHPTQNRWYSRDIAAIATAKKLGKTVPYFIDADATPNPGGWPLGGLTVITFPNSHLVYAITWFALAFLCGFGSYQVFKRSSKKHYISEF